MISTKPQDKMARRFSLDDLVPSIEPDKCIVEDFEIIAFENEQELNFYSVWHESLFDKRRELNAENERERQIIRNEIAKKTSLFSLGCYTNKLSPSKVPKAKETVSHVPKAKLAAPRVVPTKSPTKSPVSRLHPTKSLASPVRSPFANKSVASKTPSPRTSPFKSHPIQPSTSTQLSSPAKYAPARPALQPTHPDLPNGLSIINSEHYKTLPTKQVKYKITKMYKKFRGIQERRNLVLDRQKQAKLEAALSKSQLNPWVTYMALRAVHDPEPHANQVAHISAGTNPKFYAIPTNQSESATTVSPGKVGKTKSKNSIKFQTDQQSQSTPIANPNQQLQLIYFDPHNLITYSNKIRPQRVQEYRATSHLLPSTANSKRSSAASYDVIEIMEVLVNSTKDHVSITRNANKPAPKGGHSIFSHSINPQATGIVSTQLHHQARSYLDTVARYNAEAWDALAKGEEELRDEECIEDEWKKYFSVGDNQ